jgi:hypothetical protein
VTVTVPASGKVLVTVTAELSNSASAAHTYMGFAVSGATTVAASDAQALSFTNQSNASGMTFQASATYRVTGLTAGSNTFTAKYKVSAASTGTYVNRNIIVIPLP